MILACYFPFSWLTNLVFAPANWDAVQSSGHVYDDDILVRKHNRSEKANFFQNNAVVQWIVSACARKYFMETQPFSLNLAFFIFQLRQWALEPQSVFGYLQTLIFEPETSKLLMNLSQESSFQSKKNQKTAKVKFNKRTDFLWFKSWLFAL